MKENMKVRCPIPQCGNENSLDDVRCSACGTNLQAYHRALLMPDDLFNRGLSLSQEGHFQQAEQCLQSAVLFSPRDVEALLLIAHVQALQENFTASAATLARVLEKGTREPRLETILTVLQQTLAGSQADVSQPAAANRSSLPAKAAPDNQSERQPGSKPSKPLSSQPAASNQKRKKKHK
jgi:hypothetical protein